jgi:hypothetical protein
MADDIQPSIRTRELRLVDAGGNDRAVMTTNEDGSVAIRLLNGQSKPTVSLSVEKDGRLLIEAVDGQGIQRLKLDMKGNGSHTELAFSERDRKPRMVLMAEDKGPAGLFILDQYGKALFSTTP